MAAGHRVEVLRSALQLQSVRVKMCAVYRQLLGVVCLTLAVNDVAVVLSASRRRRHEPGTITHQQKLEIVHLHNKVRRKEDASDMELMTWDDTLAEKSMQWAAQCKWEHGGEPLASGEQYGQNLYAYSTNFMNFTHAIEISWSEEEKVYYDYNALRCDAPTGKMCGHYTQVVWAASHLVGCAYYHCNGLENLDPTTFANAVYLVCDYLSAQQDPTKHKPFNKGRACSQCGSGAGWCIDKLCSSACSAEAKGCSCAAQCHNCATLDHKTCRCSCADGWTGIDCQKRCKDYDEKCNPKPGERGWPPSMCDQDFVIKGCPAMCGKCKVDPNAKPGQCPVVYGTPTVDSTADLDTSEEGSNRTTTAATTNSGIAQHPMTMMMLLLLMMMMMMMISSI